MPKMTLKRRIGFGVLLTILLVGGAFLYEQTTIVQGSQNGELILVMQNDHIVAYLDSGSIKQLNIQERALRKDKSISDHSELVQLKLNIGASVGESTPTEVEIGTPTYRSGCLGIDEASLDFVLGSAGVVNYHKVRVYGVGDNEGSSLSKEEIAIMTLSPNENRTLSLLDKANGNHVKINEVSKLLIEN